MSKMAADCNAINLSQGFPDFDADPELIEKMHQAMLKGFNQYAPMPGYMPLRMVIADVIQKSYGRVVRDRKSTRLNSSHT